jgi:hypothetical protein
MEVGDVEKVVTLCVFLLYLWRDGRGQRGDVINAVRWQKPLQKSVVHVY